MCECGWCMVWCPSVEFFNFSNCISYAEQTIQGCQAYVTYSLKARLRVKCNKKQWHSSLNLVSQQIKLCNIFIFEMAYQSG